MDSNRVRVAGIREATFGTLPGSPRMRTARITGESLAIAPQFFTPAEIRADRMSADPTLMNLQIGGGLNFELSYVPDLSFFSEVFRSAFFNAWARGASWDNSEIASSIASITLTTTLTVVDQSASGGFAGTAAVAGHVLRNTGFTNAGNNGFFRVSSSTATTLVTTGLTNETPPATARTKVVGFQGATGDITATASGLASTALNFTTLGLQIGQWIKVGDVDNPSTLSFATAANNGWARITGIAANALTLDNLPTGWAVDAGTGRTIRCYFGDTIRNGVTRSSLSIEKAFLSQGTPTLIQYNGMVVDQLSLSYQTDQAITGSAAFMGLGGSQGTTAIPSSTYVAAPTGTVMTANASVGRIAENGSPISIANWIRRLDVQIANNLRRINGVGRVGAYDLGTGEVGVTGTAEAYFSDNTLLARLLNGTVTNLNARAQLNNQAMILGLPRVTFTDGHPQAAGKNQDVTLPLQFVASIDPATSAEVIFDRFEYFN